jgi:4-amino-4-deoxy-L-arabinose transferase-like glycosyltransferase
MLDRSHLVDALVLAAVLVLVLAWPVLSPPISHHGEAREGLVVQDIVAHGHWVLPRRNGELPSKPPLFHWSAAAATHLFGAGDASLRLPSAGAALLVVLATYALGVLIGGRITGWLASGILLGMVPFLTAAGEARVDMVFAATITVALAAFYVWDARGTRSARALCYAGVAAAVLAKGPAGAVLPALVILVFLAVERRLGALWQLFSWPLVLATLAIDVGWYVLAYAEGGRAFLHLQLVHENLERIVGGASFHHSDRSGFGRMAMSLLAGLLPWSLALAWCGIERVRDGRLDRPARFLHTWWIVVLAVFTLAAGKRAVYLLPACPAVALLAGRLLAAGVREHDGATSWLRWLPPPARLRRLFPHHPRLALVGLALVAFDLGALLVLQTVREIRSRRGSLVAFADAVRQTVPESATLLAATGLRRDETLILAYRTARAIPREPEQPEPGAYYLVPAAEGSQRWWAGYTMVAESKRERGPNVALMRSPD